VDAREVERRAPLPAADAKVSGLGARCLGAAFATEAVAAVPVGHGAGVGEDRGVARGEACADVVEIDEFATKVELGDGIIARELDGEVGCLVVLAEEDGRAGLADESLRIGEREEDGSRVVTAGDEVPLPPYGD